MKTIIHNVPTNIISGFLGVGKTTAILSLFSQKPLTEKWAVLVNEFGKVGIDGHIYKTRNIAVKEIPGGCMCCAQGLPLQVAVNRLLSEVRPDRLIIESSGVGHPAGVLKTLNSSGFNNVLTLKAGICLLDPEHLINPDFQHNELFKEQLQFSDILVANKIDRASTKALHAFDTLCDSFLPAKVHIAKTMNGQLDVNWLDYKHQKNTWNISYTLITPEQAQYWQTHTFNYENYAQFDINALKRYLKTAGIVRMKGFIQSDNERYLLNCTGRQVDLTKLENDGCHPLNSYIEVIGINLDIKLLAFGISNCIVC